VGEYPSDTPGAIFVVFQPEPTFPILAAGVGDKITIAFARKRDGMDVLLPIDTTVVETKPGG
jgi:hypothetical protein